MIRWFRTKRQLIARDTDLEAIVAKQIDEIAGLRAEIDEGWNRAIAEQGRLMRQRDDIHRDLGQQIRTQAATIADQQERLARVVEELHKLRDDIARQEQAEAEALTYMPVRGFGMARPADRPLVWQTADAIDQDAAAKRNEDI